MKSEKVLTSILLTFSLLLFTCEAAVPLSWTVETTRAQPATFEAYQGETIDFEAALQSRGKPLEAPLNYSFFWQTNGMGNLYWEAPVPSASSPTGAGTNVLFATFTPSMDVGARVYNCFIGSPSNIYHAAFQLRLRPSPGATPNELPLPTPVIDFAKVRVLNPPWSGGGGGDTNAVRDIVRDVLATNGIRSVDGAARPLPKYLHLYEADDSYPDAAAEYYRQRELESQVRVRERTAQFQSRTRTQDSNSFACSAVRSGGFLCRNFDYPFDDRAEFVVRMSAGTVPPPCTVQPPFSAAGAVRHRFASVGVAQVGTNLTEQIVTSGKPEYSHLYKWLPGATVDGINENGVVADINVVDGDPQTSGWHNDTGDLHPLAAVRWILDNATNAQHAAEYIASHISFPAGWSQNFHYMIADAEKTYIVENGTAYQGGSGVSPLVMTNFRLYPTRDTTGAGQERYDLLAGGASITNAWYTRAYRPDTTPPWVSEFDGDLAALALATNYWARAPKEAHRGEIFNSSLLTLNSSLSWWQTVHTSVYDITNRTLRVAVQETDDWYVFALQRGSGVSPLDEGRVIAIANDTIATNDTVKAHTSSISSLSSSVSSLQSSKADKSYIDETVIPAIGDAYSLADSAKQKADAIEPIAMDASQKAYAALDQLQGKADVSMISATDPTFSNEVATVARTVTPPPSPTLRLYDEVRQCWWLGKMVNGVMQWEVE